MNRSELHENFTSSCIVVAEEIAEVQFSRNDGIIRIENDECRILYDNKTINLNNDSYTVLDTNDVNECIKVRKNDLSKILIGNINENSDHLQILIKIFDVLKCKTQHQINECQKQTSGSPWYVCHMLPRDDSKEASKFAWLDPSGIYSASGGAFKSLIKDLVIDIKKIVTDDSISVVGIDAMGFIVGSAISFSMGLPFIPFRKSGKLCVQTEGVEYADYSLTKKVIESRISNPSLKGKKIIIADQWIETGGTSLAAVQLVETLGGIPIACVAVAAETKGRKRINIPIVTAIHTSVQHEIDSHDLSTFSLYK